MTSRVIIASICCCALALLGAARAQQPDPDSAFAARFAPRAYASGERSVWVSAAPDLLVVRTRSRVSGREVARWAEAAAVEVAALQPGGGKLEGTPRIAGPARSLRPHGLYLLELVEPVERAVLVRLAATMARRAEVVQTYPALARGHGRAFADDHLVVKAKPGRLETLLSELLPLVDGELARRSRIRDTALVRVGARHGHDAVEASRWLAGQAKLVDLAHAEPDIYRELELLELPNDPLLSSQWHLDRAPGSAVPGSGQIFAPAAWSLTPGSPEAVIAVFDTGMETGHEDLALNMLPGFDAVDTDEDPSPECSWTPDGRDVAASCPAEAPYRESHATAVAGVAAGRGGNGAGVTGVCLQCSIMPVRIIGTTQIGASLATAEAFDRAVADGAWVINNSWGPGYSRFFPLSLVERAALFEARLNGRGGKGTVVVFAAGNSTSDVAADAYARQADVIAVAASTNLDDWAYYSNYGAQIDVCAPSVGGAVSEDGYGIVTTDLSGSEGYDSADYASDFGGTSAAAPIVSGLAGLMLSANPELTADQVRLILGATADRIRADKIDWLAVIDADIEALWEYDETGHSLGFGYGRVNAAAAVAAALDPPEQGALCSTAGCAHCDAEGRCQAECGSQADCPDGSVCEQGLCTTVAPRPADLGEPCVPECDFCLPTLDSDFNDVSICTQICTTDEDCPGGFDCRLTEVGGPSVCAVGVYTAGEPANAYNCFDDMFYARIQVQGDDGQAYCTDICTEDAPGVCPYGFHCARADCDCTNERNGSCREYTCHEASFANWPFYLCMPDPGFGVTCAADADCRLGDYCGPDGACRIDDRDGCLACTSCVNDGDCGPRGSCRDLDDGMGERCLLACGPAGECPGDASCQEVSLGGSRTRQYCVSPWAGAGGEVCAPDYTCGVGCRDDLPCPDGSVCDLGRCVLIPEENGAGGGGCDCSGTPAAGLLPVLAALLLARRRRGRRET